MNDYKDLVNRLKNNYPLSTERDAADAIEQLVKERDELVTKCQGLENERDAAVADLRVYWDCIFCKWFIDGDCTDLKCEKCHGEHWEWRGVQNETD